MGYSEYLKNGKLLPQTLLFVQKLIWLELQLGRIPHILAWMEVASILANQLLLDEGKREKYDNERTLQDRVLGILFLKTELWSLKWLDFLPPVLEQAGLLDSWMALLYTLGYEDYLRSEKVIPESESPETVRDLFYRWLNQPASKDLPDQPELLLGDKVILKSYVLGCEVTVESPNNLTSVYLAETILGALEAFLATSFDSETLPFRSELRIVIRPSDFLSGLPEYLIDEPTGGQTITVRHPSSLQQTSREERHAFREWLEDFIINAALQIAVISDIDFLRTGLSRAKVVSVER